MDKMELPPPSYKARSRLHVFTGEKGVEKLPEGGVAVPEACGHHRWCEGPELRTQRRRSAGV